MNEIDPAARPFAALHEAMWLQLNGHAEAAEAIYVRIEREPTASIARRQLDLLYRGQKRWADATQVMRAHAAAHPDNAPIRYHLSTLLLAEGRYAEGLPLYEARRLTPLFRSPHPLGVAEWTGDSVGELLVLGEQGLGDAIQFARYIPRLIAAGNRVTLACRPELASLFSGLGARIALSNEPLPPCDAWTYLGSLPLRFGERVETIDGAPYLAPPAAKRSEWAAKLPGAARIGTATRGNPIHPNNANRSLPPEAATFVQSFQGAVSLDFGETPLPIRDFADTAAVIERLDLVISVDTAVAHLAGALGKPCWLMLPYQADWRWLHERTDTPWYASVRLYRQPAPGDWLSVLGAIRRDLAGD